MVGEHLEEPFVVVGEGYDKFCAGEPQLLHKVVEGSAYVANSPRVILRPTNKLVFGCKCYSITSGEGDTVGEGGYRVVLGTGKITGRKELERGMQDVPILNL